MKIFENWIGYFFEILLASKLYYCFLFFCNKDYSCALVHPLNVLYRFNALVFHIVEMNMQC